MQGSLEKDHDGMQRQVEGRELEEEQEDMGEHEESARGKGHIKGGTRRH